MKSYPRTPESQEVELKLSLPGANPTELAKRLGSLPLLAGGKATRQSLHNIYFDTADQHLRRQRAALRLRRIGSAVHPQWVQTLKSSAADESALSRRGEWETAVPSAQLSLQALQSTPWTEMDPDTRLFDSLEPCFVTDFQRTSWLLTRPDGSVVELALDIGQIEANGRQASICEIELELKSGQVGALFEVAQRIAITVAVLPANQSKAERGFLLAQDGLDQPKGANPPPIGQHLSQTGLAQQVLREMFAQFTHNLNALRSNDDPELVHQARVGWRRFRSAMRLFKKLPQMANAPVWPELAALLSFLGELRNLEVALLETLPPLANGYCRGDEQRTQSWQEMLTSLRHMTDVQRRVVRDTLQEPGVGVSLLLISEWLENLTVTENVDQKTTSLLRQWAKRRILRLDQGLKRAQQATDTPEQQHRVRIRAKRLRYGVQALHNLLPARFANRSSDKAAILQTAIGVRRDLFQASVLVATLNPDHGIVQYLLGVVVGSCMAAQLT